MAALVAIAGLTSGQLLLQLYCVQLRLLKGGLADNPGKLQQVMHRCCQL
jgi:hypothetical protein